MSIVIPRITFDSCDETSLKLKWGAMNTSALREIRLQYKEVYETWEQAKDHIISLSNPDGVSLTEAECIDLKPGTPYYVRLAVITNNGDIEYGPENVFDTKPVDCGPKGKKKCIIM